MSPEDQTIVDSVIATARARGVQFARGKLFRRSHETGAVVQVCALGADYLDVCGRETSDASTKYFAEKHRVNEMFAWGVLVGFESIVAPLCENVARGAAVGAAIWDRRAEALPDAA